jgi:hypothetical protein
VYCKESKWVNKVLKKGVEMRKLVILLVAAVLFGSFGVAEAASVESRLAKLEALVEAQQKEISALKAQKTRLAQQVRRSVKPVDQKKVNAMVSKAISEQKSDLDLPEWVQNWKFKGDLRYRQEYTDDDSSNKTDYRNVIRLRFGFDAKVNDEVDATVRLATGSSSKSNSTNTALTDYFGRKDIFVDLAYFDYHPDAIDNLNIYAGKVNNPFYRVGSSELIWDVDTTPEGGVLTYNTQINSALNAFVNTGAFYVRNQATEADATLLAVQGGVKYDFNDNSYIKAGATYYDFANIQGDLAPDSPASGHGNSVDGSDRYTNDYDILEIFGEAGFPVCDMPVRVFGNYAKNLGALSSNTEDSAWLIGAGIGKCTVPGSWQFLYHYKDVEADAVVSQFKDGTFAGGNTDSRGHIFGLGYQVAKSWQLNGTWYHAKKDISTNSTDHEVLLIDLLFKF